MTNHDKPLLKAPTFAHCPTPYNKNGRHGYINQLLIDKAVLSDWATYGAPAHLSAKTHIIKHARTLREYDLLVLPLKSGYCGGNKELVRE